MARLQFCTLILVTFTALCNSQNDVRKPPHILEPNRSTILYFQGNRPVEIKCKAEGTPQPTYRWTRNGNVIVSDNIVQYDPISGSLKFTDFTKREEGTYMCVASNVFDNAEVGRITASSFSPPVKLYQTRIGQFIGGVDSTQQVTEYSYAILTCGNKGEVVGADSDININWYERSTSRTISLDGGRLFIDHNGNLHFQYTLARDGTSNFAYLCGISSTNDNLIRVGNVNFLSVAAAPNPIAIKPQLQYSNSGVKGLRFSTARLECVFSGYDSNPPHLPIMQWFDDSGREIIGSTGKYTYSENKRALTITNLQEEDERNYFCQAKNSAGVSNKAIVHLDVTSAPIFLPNGAPRDQTVIEKVDVSFNCEARSASNEAPPNSPIWYINGIKMGQHTDPSKFQLSNGNKRLTVLKVKKATDILCVQCEVTNHVDTTWADACLNVILPITIVRSFPPRQEIHHGDVIDLTATARTDPSMSLNYRWEFNNRAYTGSDLPPFVFYDPITMAASINTSSLTHAEYNTVGGLYRRVIFHTYETVHVETLVVLKDKADNPNIVLNIRKPPHILEPNRPTILYFQGNLPVEIKCKAEGTPQPTYKWTRNGNVIVSDNIVQYDSISGSLKFTDFTKREEGTYMCVASNVFDNAEVGRITASSFSPPVKLYQTRIEKFTDGVASTQQVKEYGYAMLTCGNKGEVVGAQSDINLDWYESSTSRTISLDGGRLFIDQNGNLHFSYTLAKDATVNFIYLCGISSISEKLIRLGNANFLSVVAAPSPSAIIPQLQYSNSGVKGLRFSTARLECVFSGYDPSPPHVPIMQWFDDSGNEITDITGKYTYSENKRALTINNLQEEDERNYFCQAKNSAGVSNTAIVHLDVTSAPIFLPNGAPRDQTVIENVDVSFNCDARSASNEAPPSSPVWYINGIITGRHIDPSKFLLSNGNKRLTVLKVKKATDILCVQCEVTNHVDTTWADACLNVILPITIVRSFPPRQEIHHGDVIDLTVTAKTDPAMSLNYRWEFNNRTYSGSDLPPFVSYDPITMAASINTSSLTQTEYNTVCGLYRCVIFHTYETVHVETLVVLKDKA